MAQVPCTLLRWWVTEQLQHLGYTMTHNAQDVEGRKAKATIVVDSSRLWPLWVRQGLRSLFWTYKHLYTPFAWLLLFGCKSSRFDFCFRPTPVGAMRMPPFAWPFSFTLISSNIRTREVWNHHNGDTTAEVWELEWKRHIKASHAYKDRQPRQCWAIPEKHWM